MKIYPQGDKTSKIWVLIMDPYEQDNEKGYIFSGSYGYVFNKLWSNSGISYQPYIDSIRPCLGASYDDAARFNILLSELHTYAPPIIVTLGDGHSDPITNWLVPETKSRGKESSLGKWAGSLLKSPFISYPHYIIPNYAPHFVSAYWAYHEIQQFIDFGHIREEYEYFANNQKLLDLPIRQLITEPSYDVLMNNLNQYHYASYLSTDIETIRPRKDDFFHKIKHPGYPYTIALAPNPWSAISFSFWDYTPEQAVKIWRELDWLLYEIPQIGQNYFTFDSHFLEALGFRICLDRCSDTLLRHHILWPSLEHKLQFQTKQYTRQPYYKDEGKQWHPKYKKSLMHYNALDAVVTYEIWERQNDEFKERPHLA